MPPDAPGRLIIISGPSGAGKSTVVRELIKQCSLPLILSISATTRPARYGEEDGRDYFFLSDEEFAKLREEDGFLECEEVFGQGHWYGTLRPQVTAGLNRGQWVILEIDVRGAMSVLEFPELEPITIFLHPGSAEELERRLRDRGTDSGRAIARRLAVATREMQSIDRYRHEVINDTIDRAATEICEILKTYQE